MSFGKLEANVYPSDFATGGCAKRARPKRAAAMRRHRDLERRGPDNKRSLEAGFTYIGLLVLIALMGIALVSVSELWQTVQKRDKEQELLFIGNQFRRAIAMYSADGDGSPHQLEDLLKDPRFPGVRRSLRKIYRDPMTGRAEWGLVKPDGNSIIGVYSLSDAKPLKQSGFSLADRSFEAKNKYSEWVFGSKAAQGGAPASATPVAEGAQASGAVTASPTAQESAGATTPADSDTTSFDEDQLLPGRTGPRRRR